MNFESLIATKATRIKRVSGNRVVIDWGLRRAQGLGGLQASRAAIIIGINATSNVFAGYHYNLKITGIITHSCVQSFNSKLDAFRKYAEENPELIVHPYEKERRKGGLNYDTYVYK